MTHAIRFHATGGPEVLRWEEVAVADVAPNEARVRHHAVGLNFIDIYHRTGLYPAPLPSGIGLEAAGVVEAVGSAVSDLKAGDRVAYAGGPLGAYAELRNMPADRLVKLPDAIDFKTGAAMMLQGMTAQYLLHRTCPVQPGDTILIHAAAGGVGLIVCQWAKAMGVTVIGTVGSDEKAALAKAHGCTHTINYNTAVIDTGHQLCQIFTELIHTWVIEEIYSICCIQNRNIFVVYNFYNGICRRNITSFKINNRMSFSIMRGSCVNPSISFRHIIPHVQNVITIYGDGDI